MKKRGMELSRFVGGEFYYDTRWRLEQPVISTKNMNFLNGGKACLIVISEWLRDHGISDILLPSYLCPTIVDTLERCGMHCVYYQVNTDFSIDLDDLSQRIKNHRAVYLINYFGFLHPIWVRNYMAYLGQEGMIVVEDNAQAGFVDETVGDFVFNSMRKLVPYDGGYMLTSQNIVPYIQKHLGAENRRLSVIREYRRELADYLFHGKGDHAKLERLYQQAEDYYEADWVVEGDVQERLAIEHLDWTGIRQARRENYQYLLGRLHEVAGIEPIFPVLPDDAAPLGLPIYVNGFERDRLFDALGEAGIGLTIHWDGIMSDSRLNGNNVAVDMAERILTLVCDQRWDQEDMEYMVERLRETLIAC